MAVVGAAWPTLLGSSGLRTEAPQLCRRPVPLALEMPTSEACGVRVRNTFLEVDIAPPPGLEQPPLTCPSKLMGRLLLDDVSLDAPEDSPVALPTPAWAETPSVFGSVRGGHAELLVWRQSPAAGGEPKKLMLQLAEAVGCGDRSRTPSPPAISRWAVGAAKAPLTPPPLAPAPGSLELPSVGSAGHADGSCKPCAFAHAGRCANGPGCSFCHLCGPDERKRRRREKLQASKAGRESRREAGASDRQRISPR